MNLNGGYGVRAVRQDGTYEYTPTETSSTWVSLVYGGKVGEQAEHGQKLQGILFAGYVHNLGTREALAVKGDGTLLGFYYPRVKNMNRMYRLSPTLIWTIGKFQVGCEYEVTSVLYGDATVNAATGLSDKGLHWVTNHRVQLMTKYNF